MTAETMIREYHSHSAAATYALGFLHDHSLFAVKLGFEELAKFFKLDHTSAKRGGYAKIRIRLTAEDRAELSAKAERLGAEDLLTKDAKHNKGENFERELTERWTNESWVKDSVPFWVAGDIRVNGVEIQVKLDGAELTNERTIAKLMA